MKALQIEDDVYDFLCSRTARIGESASEILRRELRIPQTSTVQTDGKRAAGPKDYSIISQELWTFLRSPAFLVHSDAVGKWLAILTWLYKQNPHKFDAVLALSGRKRRYFGRTAEEIEKSGNSVMPKRIPATPYWVATNNDTARKKRMLEKVMRMLQYDAIETLAIVEHVK